jgi:alcohol dehydrogenase (cytochrome c)
MKRTSLIIATLLLGAAAAPLPAPSPAAPLSQFRPVTPEVLLNPDPADWLMIDRTLDDQRYSPLAQINRGNVAGLRMAWSRGLPKGSQETVPIVRSGIMYTVAPGGIILALDATNGDRLWEYQRPIPSDAVEFIGTAEEARTKSIAIFQDLIFYPAPDGFLVALDARTGKVRWETRVQDYKQNSEHTGGLIVADGKVITSRTCETRAGCFIAAHDAMTGREVWKFYTTPADGEPGAASWGKVPTEKRIASSWGQPGSYDPVRKVLYWGISNPKPYTRLKRHGGDPDAVSRTAPADLYSNSTVAIDVATGKLNWYYQHLPGDDWDADYNHARILLRTAVNPDPASVKWINPAIRRGEQRDIVFTVGEAGGLWALDRGTGQFLWAAAFPWDVPNYNVGNIDVATGRTEINWDLVFKKEGERKTICFHNTKSYWSTAYDPRRNALYIPYHDACLDMTADSRNVMGMGPRGGMVRPGSDPKKFLTIAKVDLSTGKVDRIYSQPESGNGSALVTAGDLLFWGDMNRRFRAFDSDNGKILWETVLGGIIQTSTIAYAVNGKQYVAVFTGDGQSGTATPARLTGVTTVRGHNEIYVFALP